MNLPIVPFEVAKDLKELGFDWNTLSSYNPEGTYMPPWNINEEDLNEEDFWVNNKTNKDGFITAPTQAEVVKWFRDEYNINLQFLLDNDGWRYYINDDAFGSNKSFDVYEEAELEGIKSAIRILKHKEGLW